jgi:hypothetical protein
MRYIRKNSPKLAYVFRTREDKNDRVEGMVELDRVLLKFLRINLKKKLYVGK